MNNPKIYGVLLFVTVASIIAVTTVFSQNAMASAYAGQTGGSTRVGPADLDVAEAAEAGNATTAMMTNQTATNSNMTDVQFLSIQNAKSGSISQINATTYALSLNNVSDDIILFSDRPERIVKTVGTADFIGNWTIGPNSFSADEPNDALIVENTDTRQLETAIVESFNPVYDIATNSLTYTITAENATSINLPVEFGQTVLVIDVTPDSETSLICAVPC